MAAPVSSPKKAQAALVRELHARLREHAEAMLKSEREGHSLQPTELANEAYLRLLGSRNFDAMDRARFGVVSAGVIRQVLVDHARTKRRIKRSPPGKRIDIEIDFVEFCDRDVSILELHDALAHFATISERAARVIELHYFGGLSHAEIGSELGISQRASQDDCRKGLAWLLATLSP